MIELFVDQKPRIRKGLFTGAVNFIRTKLFNSFRINLIISTFFEAAPFTELMTGIVQVKMPLLYGAVSALLFLLDLIYTGISRWCFRDSRHLEKVDIRRAKVIKHIRNVTSREETRSPALYIA
jgi:hypothetical protein